MVTTRSRNPVAQAKIEDFSDGKQQLGRAESPKGRSKASGQGVTGAKPTNTKKRGAPSDDADASKSPSKKARESRDKGDGPARAAPEEGTPVIINRAPVLHLWSACVAQFVYPAQPWETCLSIGSAISSITAIAKGRSIGKIEPPGEDTDEKRKKREQRPEEDDVVEVMHFKLRIKDGLALVGSEQKGKPGGDGSLRAKFGKGYERTKAAFDKALVSWEDDREELNKRAFGMYEDFRPSVKPGQGGWGRKGELDFGIVKSAVEKD